MESCLTWVTTLQQKSECKVIFFFDLFRNFPSSVRENGTEELRKENMDFRFFPASLIRNVKESIIGKSDAFGLRMDFFI